MNTSKPQSHTQKLSASAATALVRAMYEHDSVVEKQRQIIDNANLDIAEAMDRMEQAYARRKSLSDELDKFAPDDFMQDSGHIGFHDGEKVVTAAVSPFPPAPFSHTPKPWHKPSPMPKRTQSVRFNVGSEDDAF